MTDPTAPSELGLHLERQMRAQERQLVWARFGTLVVAALALLLLAPDLPALPVLLGVLVAEALYTAGVPFLVSRFPAREVGIVSTAVDMAAVTVAAYAASNALDIYLFYGLVILGTALRFGFGAAVWSAVIMSGLYAVVVVIGSDAGAMVRELLPTRVAFLLGFGLVAGLFSRILIGRATENARLQQRLAEEERDRERRAEAELLARIGRDAAASLDRSATHRAVVEGAAPVLGDATLLLAVDDATRRLTVEAADGPDAALVTAWRQGLEARRPRVGEGIAGAVAATAASRAGAADEATGDPDALRAAGAAWMYATPILAGGRLLGVLATASREAPPDGRVARLADSVAERAGPAVQNAELWADLQRRMAAEQAAQRVKDDFLSIVSHELRTPLTSIQGYSQLLEGRLAGERDAGAKELAHLRVIRSQVSRMRRLVDDLLDVSRIDRRGGVSIETADFDMAEEVRDAVARAGREHPDRSIEITAPETLPVHADRDRIDQVLGNLIENAVKYSPDGGPIRVECERRGGEVEVRVTDEGIGIPPEHRDHVFERFYQADGGAGGRRFGGLGLGLYITRAIVDAHGGRIWAAANPDGPGSVFGFRMPRIAMEPATPGIVPTGEPPAFVLRHRDGRDV
ncbi:MAG TPA: HAMP domain-containing sensor histidine kinase [Candidatus Limnocylindria bacterium]|jgi:signal transduction histidine kinase|nr:HAMP domain-containing sensor histidine kinase [Candidatus Limnocylindria bacterium]